MIIEHFKDPKPVGERFRLRGRLMPEGLRYVASWIDAGAARCFQVIESPSRVLVQTWIDNWKDLVDFEVIPVETSAEYWARVGAE